MTEKQLTTIESNRWSAEDVRDLRRCSMSAQLCRMYRWQRLRSMMVRLANRLEGGQFYSFTNREILDRHHGVHVGAYSYGACLTRGAIPAGVTIGRYCSIGAGLRIFLRNHPYDRLSMHPFFYNAVCGMVPKDTITTGTLHIEHDAWVGEQVVVTPGCQRIGLGAVVGAGAVVTRNVPDFAIVAGNPAKVIRMRFPEDVCDRIRASAWWSQPVSACQRVLSDMTRPLSEMEYVHPLLAEQGTQQSTRTGTETLCH